MIEPMMVSASQRPDGVPQALIDAKAGEIKNAEVHSFFLDVSALAFYCFPINLSRLSIGAGITNASAA